MTDAELAEYAAECLRWVPIVADVYKALRDSDVPEALACDLTFAWLTDDT